MNLQSKGVDLSAFNTEVDFEQAKNDGIQFAILCAGVGGVSRHEDRLFRWHIENALRANIKVGAYWVVCAVDAQQARQEARAFFSTIAPYRKHMTYPLFCHYGYFSMEYAQKHGGSVDGEQITDVIHAFCDEVEQRGGEAGYYTNSILVQNNLDMERLSCWKLWFAEYNGGPEYRCSIQQITDSGIVRGITGDVHIDIAYENDPK